MKNLALKAQLEALCDIGLDRVNNAVAAVFQHVALIDGASDTFVSHNVLLLAEVETQRAEIVRLAGENSLLRAELESLHKSIVDPTGADAVPVTTFGAV